MKLRWFGLLGWLLFSYLFIIQIRFLMARSFDTLYFPWDAPLWVFFDCVIGATIIAFIKQKLDLLSENTNATGRDFFILAATIPLLTVVTTVFGIVVIEKATFGKTHSLYNWTSQLLINFVIQTFVAFSCISYFYVSAFTKTQEKLLAAQRAQSEMQLKLLQQQVDPHFLFNNLNVLSSLIEKDPKAANNFLAKLAELYRYILQTQNVEIVPIRDELEFAQNYLYLLKQRFGEAYDFDWQVLPAKLDGQMIVPAALQGLLENVVKHNAGSQKDPLRVRVELTEEYLVVENELRAKSRAHPISGTGLQNVRARYALLTDQSLEIAHDENFFAVKLPLLKLKK